MFYLFCKHFYLVQSKKSAILHFPQWIICSCNLGVSSFDKNQPKDKLRKGSWTRVFDLKRDSWAFQIHPKACQIYTNLSIFLIIPFWIKISFWKWFFRSEFELKNRRSTARVGILLSLVLTLDVFCTHERLTSQCKWHMHWPCTIKSLHIGF